MLWLILFLPHVVLDRVDVVELNHVICPTNGNEQGAYWIWWRWQIVDGRADYYVADWRRMTDVPRPVNGVQEWIDGRTNIKRLDGTYDETRTRRVESKVFCETWTFYDRESEDRKRLPVDRRRKLTDRRWVPR